MVAEAAQPASAPAYVDERARGAVGDAMRMSRLRLTMAWWGIASALFYVFLGANLALFYGAANALVGMIAAVVFFGCVGGALASYAVQTGSSSSALSLVMLGRSGGALPTFILAATGVYYAVFEGSVLAVAVAKVIPGLDYHEAALIVVLYSTPLAAGSVHKLLDKLNGVTLPLYLGGLLLLVGLSLSHSPHPYGAPALAALGKSWAASLAGAAVWHCFIAYLGLLGMTMVTMDFARFGRRADERYHARVAFGVPFYALTFALSGVAGMVLIDAIAPGQVTETSVVDSSLAILGAAGGLAWVFVTQTRINSTNYYVATLNFQAAAEELFGVRVPKIACAAVTALAVLILMWSTNVFSSILTALAYQGVFVTAWVGVALAHVCRDMRRRRAGGPDVDNRDGEPRRFNVPGITAWLAAVMVGTCLLLVGSTMATFSAPATLLLAVCLYWMIRARGEKRRHAH